MTKSKTRGGWRGRMAGTVAASSLLITVIIALVIGGICVLLILSAYNNVHIAIDARTQHKLERNAQSSVNLVLAGDGYASDTTRQTIDLFGAGNDSATVQQERWGMYGLASLEVRDRGRAVRQCFFMGDLLPDSLSGCVYLADHQRPLLLVGAGKLIGDAWLPKAGAKPGYVDQRGYDDDRLIEGDTRESGTALPELEPLYVHLYDGLPEEGTQSLPGNGAPVLPENEMPELPDSMVNSFFQPLKVVHVQGRLSLTHTRLEGHILVISDSSIEVEADAQLVNVILRAPQIRIRSGFSGTVQAFGTDSLIVERDCHFGYPSGLAIIKRDGFSGQPALVVGEDCSLAGGIFSYASPEDKLKTYVEIGARTLVQGVLYTGGYLCLKGTVWGCVLTDYFIYREKAMTYDNYLVDATVDRGKLRGHFVGPAIFKGRKKNRVLQWVN